MGRAVFQFEEAFKARTDGSTLVYGDRGVMRPYLGDVDFLALFPTASERAYLAKVGPTTWKKFDEMASILGRAIRAAEKTNG